MGLPAGLESTLSRIANVLEKPREAPTQKAPAPVPTEWTESSGRLSSWMLAAVAGILDEHRSRGAERAMALTNDTGKGGGRGKRGQESNLEARKRTMEEGGSFSSGVSKNWERNYLAVVPCARSASSLPLSPRSHHAMWSSPRFNRGCVRRALASFSTTVVLFLQRVGVNLAGRPLPSMAWSRALRAPRIRRAAFLR